MASTTKTKKVNPKPTASKSKGRDRVVKRSARGFHHFRNGMLNITPKGGEKELVKRNQNSPRLRLPAELRTQIWKYVLGGNTFWKTFHIEDNRYNYFWTPVLAKRPYTVGLLRVCRQIYSETALLPFSTNTFSFPVYEVMKRTLDFLEPYQRAEITSIEFVSAWRGGVVLNERVTHVVTAGRFTEDYLPALKCVHAIALEESPLIEANRLMHKITGQLDMLLVDRQVEVTREAIHSG